MGHIHGTVYQYIIDTARQHNISYEHNDLDAMACAITRLADNDVVSNDATRALANLRRAKIIDTPQAHKLLLSLCAEMRMENTVVFGKQSDTVAFIQQQPLKGHSMTSIEQHIRNLAQQHNITPQPTQLDDMGNAITRLAGDDVVLDEVEMLIVHLGQQGHITGKEALTLISNWQDHKDK